LTYLVAGAASGLLMMLVFVAVAPVMVFSLARDTDHWTNPFIQRFNPTTLMLSLVVLSYPTWTTVGGVLALFYRLSIHEAPGDGLGSGNLFYSVLLALIALIVTVPVAVLLRRVASGVGVIAAAFIGIYGWLLPFLVTVAQR
jgi:hypothetical protein